MEKIVIHLTTSMLLTLIDKTWTGTWSWCPGSGLETDKPFELGQSVQVLKTLLAVALSKKMQMSVGKTDSYLILRRSYWEPEEQI
ncbi:MAG: hypothetical protein EA412_05285 [Chitinophagaceae bacterium]|nr:MAG: hypothetical protein EA412_05285 [Chitinophagaceae bacterium]